MNIYPLQTNFTAGALTPRLWSRSDTQEYRNGVKAIENMITTRHGPVESRNGTEFKGNLGNFYARPFGFQLIPNSVTGEAFNAVVSEEGKLFVVGASGVLYTEELSNIAFTESLDGWDKILTEGLSSVTWSTGSALLLPEGALLGEVAGITQEVVQVLGTENDNRTISFNSELIQGNLPIETTIKVGTTAGGDDLGSASFLADSGELIFNPGGSTDNYFVSFVCQNVRAVTPPEPGGQPIDSYGTKKMLSVSSSLTDSGAVEFNHPWSASDIQNIHAEMSPNEDVMYFVCQNVAPHKLVYTLSTNTWSFQEVAFVGLPVDWITGNFPTTMGFFQGRSWWGGVETRPQTFWGSKSNDESTPLNELEDMTTGINANDGLEFSITKSGRIRWIEGGRNLVIGTTSGEFIVNGSQGVITPDDVFVSQQSTDGGASVNAKKVGTMVLFVSGDGRKLLGTRYFEDQNQWRAQELSFTAEHLTDGRRITQIAYSRNPESIIWCLLDDGNLIGCTYDPFNNSMGWHSHSVGGVILGITTVEKAGFSVLSMTVQRVIDGNTFTYQEDLGSDYLDSSLTIETTSLNISLPHLAGKTVAVKINDAQHPDVDLDVNGDGVLDYFEDLATIGLSMSAQVETLEPDFGSHAGTSMGFNKRMNEITARIESSATPLINGQLAQVRNVSTPMGFREPNKTTDISVHNLGFDDGSVVISQPLPYKLTLTGLFGKLTQSKL